MDDAASATAPSTPWALGDYHTFATTLMWQLGPELVAACDVRPGQRVLDVAAGTGNVALRAAAAGARVTASDITPESLAVGRAAAVAQGLELDWVQADAQALPFADAAFDVVTSCLGAIFAPDHQAVADELLRVCRPGGTIGMVNFTPEGLAAPFFELVGRHLPPPPPGARSPLLWGTEHHLRELLGDGLASLEVTRRDLVERMPGTSRDYCDLYRRTFGPLLAAFAAVADAPELAAALDRDLLELVTRADRGEPGHVECRYEHLLVVGRTRA